MRNKPPSQGLYAVADTRYLEAPALVPAVRLALRDSDAVFSTKGAVQLERLEE